jgi:hypothetical protein
MLNWKKFDELRNAQPFQPFRIVVSDGAQFDVPHRDFTWRTPNGSAVFVAINQGDVAHYIDPLHITRFVLLGRNGPKKSAIRGSRK